MPDIWIPLQGPTGVRPKAPAVGAWQSPGYKGVNATTQTAADWLGLRCDDLVVVDCDNREAATAWMLVDFNAISTWARSTPRGFHFIYEKGEGSPNAPYAGVYPNIDIRAGVTSQIVYHAPGYKTITERSFLKPFNPAWLPENFGVQQDRSNDESWDEMPDGRGNNTMTALAGAMRKQGMGPVSIAKCLGAINKITMTTDPMPTEMLVEITRSVSRYNARPDVDIEIEK